MINLVGVVGVAPTSTRLKVEVADYYTTLVRKVGIEPTLTDLLPDVHHLHYFLIHLSHKDRRFNLTHGQLLVAVHLPHESRRLASTTALGLDGFEPPYYFRSRTYVYDLFHSDVTVLAFTISPQTRFVLLSKQVAAAIIEIA
jgi:hypothetical protein